MRTTEQRREPQLLPRMQNPADHAMGLELEIVELVERRHLADRFGRAEEVAELGAEIRLLQAELAVTAALATVLGEPAPSTHRAA